MLLETKSISKGKHYWEIRLDKVQNPNCIAVGVTRTTSDLNEYCGSNANSWSVIVMNRENMKKWHSPICEDYGKAGEIFKDNDVVGMLLDYTKGENAGGLLSFYVNGLCQGEAFANLPPHLFPAVSLHSKGDSVTLVRFTQPSPDAASDEGWATT